jgi:hypothetical protein
MPCSECGHVLLVFHEKEDLRCPNCLDLEMEDSQVIENKVERDRELLRDENLVRLVEDFSKDHLLLYLMERLNKISYDFYETRRLNHREFSYLNYLIKIIYPEDRDNFGDEYLERGEDIDDRIDALLDAEAQLVTALDQIEDQFRLCLKPSPPLPLNPTFLSEEYNIYDSEYRYCYWRCIESLIGGSEKNLDLFDEAHDEIRNFDSPSGDEIDTLEDFADTFLEFINSLLFIASADDVVGDIYTTFPPDYVTVFDIRDLLDEIDDQFADDEGNISLQDSTLGWTTEEEVDIAGREVFGEGWENVKETVVVSQDNLDAHPFLFKINIQRVVREPEGRPPVTVDEQRIVYPRFYSKLLRYQIFPLLQNGGKPSGHEILENISTSRGDQFERNLYEYLSDNGFECYHSAELLGSNPSEMDLLVVNHDENELWFIECKYILAETDMNTAEGIEKLNKKFDYKIFKEPGAYDSDPTGNSFPDKVNRWLEFDSGHQFRWQQGENDSDTVEERYKDEWLELEPRMLVVSNLTPSYIEKNEVEFRTDMELLQMIEGEDPVYKVKH